MIKIIKNALPMMAFIPLLAISTVKLNTVPEVQPSFNNALSTQEIAKTNNQGIDLDRLEKALKINTYFYERNMPLAGYGMQFVLIAEKYGLPYDFLPAIAVRESSGGKRYINNNPFGWGSAKIKFSDFNEAIEVVGKNLGGANPRTSHYYGGNSVKEKLYNYNGTVITGYEDEVMAIMDKIDSVKIAKDTELAYKD